MTITNARFQARIINLGLVIPRSENIPRFILGLSFGILATLFYSRDNSAVFVNKHLIGQHGHVTWHSLFIVWHEARLHPPRTARPIPINRCRRSERPFFLSRVYPMNSAGITLRFGHGVPKTLLFLVLEITRDYQDNSFQKLVEWQEQYLA